MFSNTYMFFIAIATTGCHWWEFVFIISLSAAVEDSYDEAVVHFAQRTKSCLQVVKRDLFACIGQNDLALIVFHHTMTYVPNAERSHAERSNAD